MWHIFILTLLIIAISLIFLCVRLFFGRKFVHTHVDGNKAMHARGIHCAQSLDAEERRENRFKVNEKIIKQAGRPKPFCLPRKNSKT